MGTARQSISRVFTQSQNSLYICRSCKHRLSRASILSRQQRFVSSEELPTTEKVRRKIWDTDNPPSPKDAYSGPGFLEKKRAQRQSNSQTAEFNITSEQADAAQTTQDLTPVKRQSKSAKASSADYVAAETWEGLQYVGSSGSWRDVPQQPNDQFSAWLDTTTKTAANRQQLVSCLHQALVECFTCVQAGIDPAITSHIGSPLDTTPTHEENISAYASAKFVSSPGQLGQIQFASKAQAKKVVDLLAFTEEAMRDTIAEKATEVESETTNVEAEASEVMAVQKKNQSNALHYIVQDESFLESQLDAEEPVTFLVLKRFSQLSGHRIPDPILNTTLSSHRPLSFLIDELYEMVVRPKPKKLAEVLMNKPGLNQSNVMVFPRRETPVDKEKEVGRWKVIEKELQDRGLPVFGKVKHL